MVKTKKSALRKLTRGERIVQRIGKPIILSDLMVRKALGIRKPKSEFFIDVDGLLKKRPKEKKKR